jgi:hypothetical protein
MQVGLKEYLKPTPALMRKIGDTVLILGASFTAWAGIAEKAHWLIITGAIITALGKMITNFFSNGEQPTE